MFDVQAGTENCPFCNFVIPPPPASADDPVAVDEHGVPVEPAAAVPVPDPESMILEGTLPSAPPPTSCEEPAPAPAPAAAGGGAVKFVVIAAAAFLAFKLGLLDNLLMLVGLASPPHAPPAAVAPPAQPAARQEPASPPAYEPLSSGPGGPIAPAGGKPEAEKPAPAVQWTFEGTVYDMLSFRPVKGVVLLFMTQSEEETFESRTDARGRFRIVLPPRGEGYKLVADHPEYIGEYFDETAPPIKSWSLSKRRQMRAAKPSHLPWAAKDAAPVRRDFVLFPDITDQ